MPPKARRVFAAHPGPSHTVDVVARNEEAGSGGLGGLVGVGGLEERLEERLGGLAGAVPSLAFLVGVVGGCERTWWGAAECRVQR